MRKDLVFSSVGDNSRHRMWLKTKGKRNFDLWLCYFGDGHGYPDDAEFYFSRHGNKLQNFHHAYVNWRARVLGYEHVLLVDDDIEMQGDAINRLFELMKDHDLWEAQPSYSADSHISLDITEHNSRFVLRYTNFCESGVFAFRTDQLDRIVGLFTEATSPWGVDWVVPKLLGYPEDKIAVVDEVVCRHPHRDSELDRLIPRDRQKQEGLNLVGKYAVRMRFKIYRGIGRKSFPDYSHQELRKLNRHYVRCDLVENGFSVWRALMISARLTKSILFKGTPSRSRGSDWIF